MWSKYTSCRPTAITLKKYESINLFKNIHIYMNKWFVYGTSIVLLMKLECALLVVNLLIWYLSGRNVRCPGFNPITIIYVSIDLFN